MSKIAKVSSCQMRLCYNEVRMHLDKPQPCFSTRTAEIPCQLITGSRVNCLGKPRSGQCTVLKMMVMLLCCQTQCLQYSNLLF